MHRNRRGFTLIEAVIAMAIVFAGMALVRARWEEVRRFFEGLGFDEVGMDPTGYRRGRLLSLVPGTAR